MMRIILFDDYSEYLKFGETTWWRIRDDIEISIFQDPRMHWRGYRTDITT